MKIALALYERPIDSGLKKDDAINLIGVLSQDEFLPIEIDSDCQSAAIGFITLDFADKLNFDYEDSGLNSFIVNILNDMNNENVNGIYDFNGEKIWLKR